MTSGAAAAGPPADCVLIVDDEDGIREVLAEVVAMAGCSALVAANGAEAMQILAEHHPCLIILDLLMPVMSGTEMLDAMKSVPELAALPVVISTSAPSRAPAGLPVIPKPIDINLVWEWMRRTCRCADPMIKFI
jgi:CheY-like chemotaxis protein